MLVVAAPAGAEPFKCPAPGVVLKIGKDVLRYEGQDGLWCKRSMNGKPFASDLGHVAFYYRERASGDLYKKWAKAMAELWPIAPGKSVKFVYQGTDDGSSAGALVGSGIFEHEITVEVPRSITVSAGTFVVYPIVDMHRGVANNYHRSSRTYFYAPELGANVKFEFKLISGTLGNQPRNWEVGQVVAPH